MDNEQKLELAKRKIDGMIGLPAVALRKGTARNGDGITGYTDYNWKLLRDTESRRFILYVEWVDLDGSGHRVVLPHEVVAAILRANDSLIAASRSEGAKKATETRKAKGIIPFHKKEGGKSE